MSWVYYIIQLVLFQIWLGPLIKTLLVDSPLEILDETLEVVQRCCKRYSNGGSKAHRISTSD